tara:strand:+ start:179 stop:568 length:390 start_codon:yes stop_codon:yes gene_type:complete
MKTIKVSHNTNRKKDGKPMQAAGRKGSLFASLEKLPTFSNKVEPVNENRGDSWGVFVAGAKCYYSITRTNGNNWSLVWIRPAGRVNSYSDIVGKNEWTKTVRFRSDQDVADFINNIMNHENETLDVQVG